MKDIIDNLDGLTRHQVFTLLTAIETKHDMKIVCVTRKDIEDAINPMADRAWGMSDDEWDQFQLTYLWRKGVDECFDYSNCYDWARDEWNQLGFSSPDERDHGPEGCDECGAYVENGDGMYLPDDSARLCAKCYYEKIGGTA